MATTPFDPNMGSKVSAQLSDIILKLERIKGFEMIDVNVRLPQIEDVDKELEIQLEKIGKLKKVWAGLGEGLEKVTLHYAKLNKRVKELTELEDEMNLLRKMGSVRNQEEEARYQHLLKTYPEIQKELKKTTAALSKMSETQAKLIVTGKHLLKGTLDLATRGFGFLTKFGLSVITTGFSVMEGALKRAYETQERFTQAFGAMAMQVGAGTPALDTFNQAASDMYFGSFGDLGMSIGEVTQMVGGFHNAVGLLDKSMMDNQKTLLEHARALGVDAAELGGMARTYLMMNMGAKEVDGMMNQLREDSAKLGVQSSLLSKNLLVAGKNLLAMTSPKWQKSMASSINLMYKMGIAAQTVEKFTDMTDSFDRTAESMAKLNTMFGTHLNALEIFAEQDPLKRWTMISNGIKEAGVNLKNLSRVEKKIIADQMGLTMDEVNALITGGQKGLKAHQAMAESWDQMLSRTRSTIVNWVKFFDEITVSVVGAFAPLFETFGLTMFTGEFKKGEREIKSFAKIMKEYGDAIKGVFKKLAIDPKFQESVRYFAEGIERIFKRLMAWMTGPDLPLAIKNLMIGFEDLPRKIESALIFLLGDGQTTGFLPKLANAIAWVVDNIGKIGIAFGVLKAVEITIMLASAAGGFWALATAVSAVLSPLLIIVGTFLTVITLVDLILQGFNKISEFFGQGKNVIATSADFGGMDKMLAKFIKVNAAGLFDFIPGISNPSANQPKSPASAPIAVPGSTARPVVAPDTTGVTRTDGSTAASESSQSAKAVAAQAAPNIGVPAQGGQPIWNIYIDGIITDPSMMRVTQGSR